MLAFSIKPMVFCHTFGLIVSVATAAESKEAKEVKRFGRDETNHRKLMVHVHVGTLNYDSTWCCASGNSELEQDFFFIRKEHLDIVCRETNTHPWSMWPLPVLWVRREHQTTTTSAAWGASPSRAVGSGWTATPHPALLVAQNTWR